MIDDTECQDCLHEFPNTLNSKCCPLCHSKKIRVIYFKSGQPASVTIMENNKSNDRHTS